MALGSSRDAVGSRAILLLCLLVPACACGGDRPLRSDLEQTGLVLFLPAAVTAAPDVADTPGPGVEDMDPASGDTGSSTPQPIGPTAVRVTRESVVIAYGRGDHDVYDVVLRAAPEGPLCAAVEQLAGSECTGTDVEMVSSMEESATVAVRRGRTLLVLRGLVVEPDGSVVDRAVRALRSAPEVTAAALSAAVD